MANCKQISITRTEGEWTLIRRKLVPAQDGLGQDMKCLSKHIRREVLKYKNLILDIPDNGIVKSGGEMIEKRPWIDTKCLEDIKWIATKMKVSPSVVIDRLIITPLLQP